MIVIEKYEGLRKTYDFVYSDKFYIIRRDDGEEMLEDLVETGTHTYEETDRKIDDKPVDEYQEAVKILMGLEE